MAWSVFARRGSVTAELFDVTLCSAITTAWHLLNHDCIPRFIFPSPSAAVSSSPLGSPPTVPKPRLAEGSRPGHQA